MNQLLINKIWDPRHRVQILFKYLHNCVHVREREREREEERRGEKKRRERNISKNSGSVFKNTLAR